MATVVQKSAFKPGKYKGKLFSAERLRQFADGSNKAITAGIPIPGLEIHAPVNADDTVTAQFSASSGAGWLKKVDVEEDGALSWEMDVPDKIEAGIKDGSIRFTSPEFRDTYTSADGKYTGPIIRHVAFTPLPKAHDQGPLTIAMSEGVYQFGEDDFEGPADKSESKKDGESDTDPQKKINPDLPADPTDKSKLEAVRACFSQLGLELTSDWTPDKQGAMDELLTGLKTLVKAKQEAETEEDDPEEPDVKESNNTPFSEEEITALPTPTLQAKARQANVDAKAKAEQAIQFAEERAGVARERSTAAVKATRLPPGLKKKLLDQLGAVQFSEAGEAPTLTIQQAAALYAESIPSSLQFDDEAETTESQHPEGSAFFEGGDQETPEQAEATARRIHSRNKSLAAK